MSKSGWDEFFKSIEIEGKPASFDVEECAATGDRLGVELPPNYCAYARRFGYGEWHDDLTILVPCNPLLVGSLDGFNKDCRSIINEWLDYERTKEADRLRRFIGFMDTSAGFAFAWDPSTRNSDGEMGIFLFQCPEIVEYCCHDLLTFLKDFWIGGKINEVYPFANGERWQTKPLFKVKQPA